MADYYVRSTDGSDADSGLTWALAKATVDGAEAVPWVDLDRVFVSNAHAETPAGSITWTLLSTGTGILILCGNDAAEPPTALATTATVTTATTGIITIVGYGYIYGITFAVGSGASSATGMNIGTSATNPTDLIFESCVFQLNNTNTTSKVNIGPVGAAGNDNISAVFKNCTFKFSAAGQSFICRHARIRLRNMSIDSAGTAPTTLFTGRADTMTDVEVENSDLSGESFANLVDVTGDSPSIFKFRNCKFNNNGASGPSITIGTFDLGGTIVILDNCDFGDTNYRFAWHGYEGSIISETTIVRTGGATDGTTTISWEMVSSANTTFFRPLRSDMFQKRIAVWNETTGSAVTATVECVTDNVTLTDKEAWIEVEYLGTAGFPQGSVDLDDRAADILATAANQTTSSETWTTTGLATPVKQKFSATFTPQEKGWVMVTVCLAKAGTTVYVDPEITLS